jgi:hypothetical protein
MLPREGKNIEYTNGSDSAHSLDDEEGSDGLRAKKTAKTISRERTIYLLFNK